MYIESLLGRLRHDEQGNLAVSTLLLVVPIASMLAMAIDQVQLGDAEGIFQSDLNDAVILFAGDLNRRPDGELTRLIADAFRAKARDAKYYQLRGVDVTISPADSVLRARATAVVMPNFMRFVGIRTMRIQATSSVSTGKAPGASEAGLAHH